MFNLLFKAHLGITVLLIYSWVRLFFLPDTARDARPAYKLKTGFVLLVFLLVAGIVSYFRWQENLQVAGYILYGFYGLALCGLLWILKNINWH
jgi:hypothetical protein